jgi:NTE family protein
VEARLQARTDADGRRVALVIGAGAIKCAAALGVHKILQENNIDIELAVGCSGGSLYAALIALGYSADESREVTLTTWTRELTKRRDRKALLRALLPRVFGFDSGFGMVDDTLVVDRLRRVYGERTFADAAVPLYIVAADFMNGDKVVLTEGKLADAIRASIALPFVFKPWRVGERLLIDGSLADPLPVDVAIRENARIILALGFDNPYQRKINSPVRFAFQVTTVMTNNLLRSNYSFHNLAHHSEIIPIIPEFEGQVSAFDTGRLPHIIERGERAMEAQMPYLERLLAMPEALG